MKKINVIAILAMLYMALATANAQQYPIDISSEANATWCVIGVTNCSTFPFGHHKFDGVTFDIPGSATANNAWDSDTAAGRGNSQVSVSVPVNIANVRTVYTLMNTNWGSTQTGLLTVTFNGTGGATWTYRPIGNVDIRDHNQDGYTNSIACRIPGSPGKAATINAWTNTQGQRLDMQTFELPASFEGQTLTSITFTDSGAFLVQRSFLAAVTVSTRTP